MLVQFFVYVVQAVVVGKRTAFNTKPQQLCECDGTCKLVQLLCDVLLIRPMKHEGEVIHDS